ncbi:MAG: class I SAM-dependent methyltransferase [Alphaproteobacteria bacterium]|nr:class I SAM-dependent methyltransferase [Alphaproteobacteria bacterium]
MRRKITMAVIGVGLALSQTCFGLTKAPEMFSHSCVQDSEAAVEQRVASIKERLKSVDPKLLSLPLDETLKILDEMAKCNGLGRWLLMHQGLNGFWTAETILRFGGEKASDIGKWIASDAPIFRATRERFGIFQSLLQGYLDAGARTFVSVPCGTMEDLLMLDATGKTDVLFFGVDLDPVAVSLINKAEVFHKETSHCSKEFYQGDAFSLSYYIKNADVIVSNGLNFYIKDDTEVIRLYESFAAGLKPGGILIVSHLSPPALAKPYNEAALKKQLAIVKDICEMRWQIFRAEELVKEQLGMAGFEVLQVIYDKQKMFPTYVCKRLR